MRTAKSLGVFLLAMCAFLPRLSLGQALSCTIQPTIGLQFRAESFTDPIGDVLIQCVTPGQPPAGQSYVTGDVKVFFSTNLTSRIGVAGVANLTDAVLIVNENHAPPTTVSTLGGPANTVPVPQFGVAVFGMSTLATNALQWSGVKIPIPGAKAPDGSTFPSRTTLRVTNLRVNAVGIGVSSSPVASQVQLASVSIADAAPLPGAYNQIIVLGTLARSLMTSASAFVPLPQCQSQNIVNGNVSGLATFTVSLTEGFESAFRPLGQPVTDQGVHPGEDGYPSPGLGANGGGADQGTRLALSFFNVPNGVRIAVPSQVTQGTLSLQLVQTDFNGAGKFNPVSGNGLVEVPGSGLAVYEVVASDNTAIESVQIPVTVGYTANPSANLPQPGVDAQVAVGYAPFFVTSGASGGSLTLPVPRFIPASFPRSVFSINACGATPVITSLVPTTSPGGLGLDIPVEVFGRNLSSGSVLEWAGKTVSSTFDPAGPGVRATIPANLLTSPGMVQVDVINPDGQRSNTLPFTIGSPLAPAITGNGVVNLASGQPVLARGSLASVYGTSLSAATASASSLPLSLQLSGTTVTVNGTSAPLIYTSPVQINFQVPFEMPTSGNAQVVVSRNGVNSPQVNVPLAEFAPGIFRSNGQALVLHADYTLVSPGKPATPNEVLIIYGTGFGGVDNAPPTGAATPVNPLATARVNPTITVGGQNAAVLYAGLAPYFVGLAQINFQMPASQPAGSSQTLVLAYGNLADTVTIAVAGGN